MVATSLNNSICLKTKNKTPIQITPTPNTVQYCYEKQGIQHIIYGTGCSEVHVAYAHLGLSASKT